MGTNADADTECAAGDCAGERFTTGPAALWNQAGQCTIASLPLAPHSAHRRNELQATYAKFEAEIEKLNQRVAEQADGRPGARLLLTHPGVGPITALATDVFLGDPTRFSDGKALASYVGITLSEYSSGGRQKFGGLSKQRDAVRAPTKTCAQTESERV
jgi:transposase